VSIVRDRHVTHDAGEQEHPIAVGVDVAAEHVPARLVLDEGERLHAAPARRLLPGFR
jgi:hypothetical protein